MGHMAHFGVTCQPLTLLDLTEQVQQASNPGKDLRGVQSSEEALKHPVSDEVSEVPPLVHQQQDHGQDSVLTQLGPEVPVQGLSSVLCLARAGPSHCSDHVQILQHEMGVGRSGQRLSSFPPQH